MVSLSRPEVWGQRGVRLALLAALASCAMLILCVQAAPAEAPATEGKPSLENSVRYLQQAQNSDGGFGSGAGEESDPDFSAWAALALASVGINPQDQARPGGADVFSYLAAHAGELTSHAGGVTTTLERVLLVVDASGTSAEDFGGVDLLASLFARQLPNGAFPHAAGGDARVNDTIFAILALSLIPSAGEPVQRASDWLEGEQEPDGGWPASCPRAEGGAECAGEEAANVEMTGAAIEALNAAGRHRTEAQARALAYLHEAQNRQDGGFATEVGGASNTD